MRQQIDRLKEENQGLKHELDKLKKANSALVDRDWFAVQGPSFKCEDSSRKLFTLDRDGATLVCDLQREDILIVGRAKEKQV